MSLNLQFSTIIYKLSSSKISSMLFDKEPEPGMSLKMPHLSFNYTDFELHNAKDSYYRVFQARNRNTQEIHTIRVLNCENQFVRNDFDRAASLFIQELLHLCLSHPTLPIIKSFEIHERKIAFATKLCHSIGNIETTPTGNEQQKLDIEKMLVNVLSDLNFLRRELLLSQSCKEIDSQSIYLNAETNEYFLGNWHQILYRQSDNPPVVAGNFAEEMYALGAIALEKNGLPREELDAIRSIPTIKTHNAAIRGLVMDIENLDEKAKNLLIKILNKEAKERPKLEDLKLLLNQKTGRGQVNNEEEKKREEDDRASLLAYQENMRKIQSEQRAVEYIQSALNECSVLFDSNCDSLLEPEFFKNFQFLKIKGVFLKIACVILQRLRDLEKPNTVGLKLWECFVQSNEFITVHREITAKFESMQCDFRDFRQELDQGVQERLGRALLSEEYDDSDAFREFLATFERDFKALSKGVFDVLTTNVTTDFLLVVEHVLNVVQWKRIFSSEAE